MSLIEPLERRTLLTAVLLNKDINDFGGSEFADAVAIQRNGRILVLGHTEGAAGGDRLFLARYDEDGELDTSFGENGRIFGPFDNFRRATRLAVDRGDRIIIAGVTSDADPAIAAMRFTSSGFLDNSFGGDGLATLQAGSGEVVNDVAVDSSGRVTVVGQSLINTPVPTTPSPAFMVARFEVFGNPDPSFGGGENFAVGSGVTSFPVGIGESGATSVVLDRSRIIVGGFGTEQESGEPAEKRFAVARLEQNGVLDEDFGTGDDGVVVVDFGLPSIAQDIALSRDGKIVVAGNTLPTLDNPGEQILIARFDRGGALDGSFGGGDGFSIAAFGGARSQFAREIVVDSKSRVLLAGEISDSGEPTGDTNDDQFVLARYLSDGSPDTSFAAGGALITEAKAGLDSVEQVAGIALQQDGKNGRVILAGNTGTTTTDQDLAVLRFATDATQKTGAAKLNGSKLVVKGTDRRDVITVSPNAAAGTIEVNVNGAVTSFPGAAVGRIEIGSRDGDDDVTCSVGGVVTTILGGDDDDDLKLLGEARGRLEGQDGDDDLTGGDFGDRLRGGRGDDILFGGDGDDDLAGDSGFDRLFGEDGDDDLKADDGFPDDVDGGEDDDEAFIDFFDFVTRVDDVEFR